MMIGQYRSEGRIYYSSLKHLYYSSLQRHQQTKKYKQIFTHHTTTIERYNVMAYISSRSCILQLCMYVWCRRCILIYNYVYSTRPHTSQYVSYIHTYTHIITYSVTMYILLSCNVHYKLHAYIISPHDCYNSCIHGGWFHEILYTDSRNNKLGHSEINVYRL